MKVKKLEKGAKFTGELPEGCKHCRQGRKMVLLVTGLCRYSCFYCPLSFKKKDKDLIYANEKKVDEEEDAIYEARTIGALGTGITGGDPLEVLDRTVHYIKLLKGEFGEGHHIHLYTGHTPDKEILERLEKAGLDEIRYHIPYGSWDKMAGSPCEKSLKAALSTGMAVGVEVPALPDMKDELKELIGFLDELGVHFLNLNELEYSETNWDGLIERGYEIRHETSNAMKGSQWVADDFLKSMDTSMSLHYCSSRFKDGVQLRRRIKRRAKNTAKKSDIISEDGLFIKGVVECENLNEVFALLRSQLEIPDELIHIDEEKQRIELAAWILENIHENIEYPCFIIEEYPTADRLEVERRPLKWDPLGKERP